MGHGIYTSQGVPDFGAFPPLLLTQEGGEGRGEEARFVEIPLSPALSPLVPRGESGNLCRYQFTLGEGHGDSNSHYGGDGSAG